MNKVLGLLLIIAAIAAALSGEPASRTKSGVISIILVIVFGISLLASKSRKPAEEPSPKRQPQLSSTPPSSDAVPKVALCPRCGLKIAPDYVACPHCGVPFKIKCPSCGRWLDPEYMVCPYCGTGLKEKQGPAG